MYQHKPNLHDSYTHWKYDKSINIIANPFANILYFQIISQYLYEQIDNA